MERRTTSKEVERDMKKSHSLISEQAQRAERFRLMKLAMDWDCFDVAKEFLLSNSLDNIMVKELIFPRYFS